MSATVVDFPEQRLRPDTATVFAVIDTVEQETSPLFDLAFHTVKMLDRRRGNPRPTPADVQGTMNLMAVACFALALAIGIPRGTLTGEEPPAG
jgi:hypothetical protein